MKLLNAVLAVALGHEFHISQETALAFEAEGIDISNFTIIQSADEATNRGVTSPKVVKLWKPAVNGGPIAVPYAIHQSLSKFQDQIYEAMDGLQNDLGCVDMPHVEKPFSSQYENGIVFIYNPTRCFSALGQYPGFKTNSDG